VTVIGQKIFAVEIDAQKSTRAKDDWRRYDLAHTTFQVHNLPCPIKLRITDLLRQLNLVFGCIDFIVTPDNQYIFLEINPMGQWYWAEALTGGAMLDSFVQMLMQGEPSMLSAGRR
jgi:glutathione synthase/RimK-type ligase-like ATP-grasp enzyme